MDANISTRKPSWKDRLTTVSKVFGVGGSTSWQSPAERARENGRRLGAERESERRERRRSSRKGEGDEWCALDVNGSDLVSFDTAVLGGRERSCSRNGDEQDGGVFYGSSEVDMDHADGFLDRVRGSKRGERSDGVASGKSSPAAGASPPSIGSRKSSFGSRLKAEGSKSTRPGSPQPLQRRPSGRGRPKLDPHDSLSPANGHASPRSVSPTRSSSRRKQSSSSNPPSRNESPNLSDPRKLGQQGHEVHSGLHVKQTHQNGKNGRSGSPASSPSPGSGPGSGESAFSKVRDTLKISKAKKKHKKKKGAAYSVDPVEINFPKYQDPFEAQPSYTDSLEMPSKSQSHDFRPVSIPHNKPEYCDHCSETAWGLYRQVLKCSSEFVCVSCVCVCVL